MPRQSRKLSKSNTYHMMMRGNERKNIFLDEEDRLKFIDILKEKKKDEGFYLYAYCLMDNHIHLLVKEGKDNISRIAKRINTSYAYYFNKKYKRVGHVFQDRYKSEEIEDEGYLLSAIRYIHNNPVRANMVKEVFQYKWSSYNSYANNDRLVESSEILELYSQKKERAIQLFIEHTNENNEDTFIELEEENQKHTKKEKIKEYIRNYLNERNSQMEICEIKNDKILLKKLILELKESTDSSIREIADILEVNRNSVQRLK